MKIRYKAIVAYNGQNYHGWAVQPKQDTIQGLIEKSINDCFRQKVKVYGAGRTDAGVNALGQVIHFDLEEIKISDRHIAIALNKALPYDIRIISIKKVDNKFNARFNAKDKTYRYSINVGKVNPIESSFIYQYNHKLNLSKLKQAAKLFVGKKNFLSFSTDERNGESVIKKINKITINKKSNIINININGDGFLRSQVRMIVGTLIAYNNKKISKKDILSLFANPTKGGATYKAPACGLTLVKVNY